MPILWLRVALVCYGVGLFYALVALTRTTHLLSRVALHAAYLGMIFHCVSLVEAVRISGQLTLTSVHNAESLLALLIMVLFMIAYLVYQTTSPGIVVFPVVFLLTFVAATGQQPFLFLSPSVRTGWVLVHVALIFTGYAALVLSFGASLLYLLQERTLKAKKSTGIISRLPALEVIDEIGLRSLLLGFPFMTLGLLAGTGDLWAGRASGSQDPALHSDVGGVSAAGVHALERGMARPARGLSRGRRLRRRRGRVVGKLFQHHP
jgi:ABC-type uncharacterized transport system permease subunit